MATRLVPGKTYYNAAKPQGFQVKRTINNLAKKAGRPPGVKNKPGYKKPGPKPKNNLPASITAIGSGSSGKRPSILPPRINVLKTPRTYTSKHPKQTFGFNEKKKRVGLKKGQTITIRCGGKK